MSNINYSNTKEIPLYKDTMLLISLASSCFNNIPKFNQITLGVRVMDKLVELLNLITIACRHPDRREVALKRFLDILINVESLIDVIILNSKLAEQNIARFAALLDQLGRLSTGWLNSTLNANS